MNTRQISLIIFYTEDKKILLQDRKFKTNPLIEWSFFWWWIEKNENPEEALIRETKEELSYDLKEYKYIWTYKNYVPSLAREHEVFIFVSPLKDINEFEQREWEKMILVSLNEARKLKMWKELDYEILNIIEKYFDSI